VQAAAVVAFDDDAHVEVQRRRYRERLGYLREVLEAAGLPTPMPAGGFYLWVPVPDAVPGGGWGLVEELAQLGGLLASPGDLYGEDGAGFVRVAVVQPLERLRLVGERLAGRHLSPA
jgi:aspartate/methionine/tyrosine aminotransferase